MTSHLDAQIRCIDRELALRWRTYPRLIRLGTMTHPCAAHELLTMQAVRETLRALRDAADLQEEMAYGPPTE